MMSALQRPSKWDSLIFGLTFVLNRDSFKNGLKDREQLNRSLRDQPKLNVANYGDFTERFVLYQLFCVVSAHVFCVVNQEMRNGNRFVGVVRRIAMFVDLTEQCTDLHVCFAPVF